MPLTEAQKRAKAKWREKNKERNALVRGRSSAKFFVKTQADLKDMIMLLETFAEQHPEINCKNAIENFKNLLT